MMTLKIEVVRLNSAFFKWHLFLLIGSAGTFFYYDNVYLLEYGCSRAIHIILADILNMTVINMLVALYISLCVSILETNS